MATQAELEELFNQGDIQESGQATNADQLELEQMFNSGAIQEAEPIDIAAAEAEAVRGVGEDLSTAEQFVVGAGRGLTNIGSVAGQLFTSATGTDEEAEAFRQAAERNKATFETGLGESTAAGIGEVVGETLPAFLAPGGVVAAGIVGGALLGAGEQAGESATDIITGAATGAVFGGATGGLLGKVGQLLTKFGLSRITKVQSKAFIDKIRKTLGDDFADQIKLKADGSVDLESLPAASGELSREARAARPQDVIKGKKGEPDIELTDEVIDLRRQKVPIVGDAGLRTQEEMNQIVFKLLQEAIEETPGKALATAGRETLEEIKSLRGKSIRELGGEVIQNLPGAAAGGILTGGTITGALTGAAVQKAAGPLIKPIIGAAIPSLAKGTGKIITDAASTGIPQVIAAEAALPGFAKFTEKLSTDLTPTRPPQAEPVKAAANPTVDLIEKNIDSPPLAKYSEGLKAAKARSSISLASTIHVLSQTEPGFQLALKKLSEEEEEVV